MHLFVHTCPLLKQKPQNFSAAPPVEGHDDELSIAMIAFHEAIQSYSQVRGAFFKYAAMLIKSRLIDYHRKEKKHGKVISLETPVGEEEEKSLGETLSDGKDHSEEMTLREATREEIQELTRQMAEFGVSLTDVAENCPQTGKNAERLQKGFVLCKGTS